MTGRPVLGLIAALIIEASHWTRLRWDFDEDACSKAWQFNSILIAIAAALIWLDGTRYNALPNLLTWMPLLFIPMQFIQSYGLRDSFPVSAFSFLARHRKTRAQRHGLIDESSVFNFGNVLFPTAMISASVGSNAGSWAFLPGLVTLSGWMFLSHPRSRSLALFPVLILTGALAIAGQLTLQRAEEWLGNSAAPNRSRFNPNFNHTLMGRPGTVRQSPDILWRIRPHEKHAPPRLLRIASFNNLRKSSWHNHSRNGNAFIDLDTLLIADLPYYILQDAALAAALPKLPAFSLRGAAFEETPLPLPGNTAGLGGFRLDGIERNPFGTIRVYPKNSVIDGSIYWKSSTNPESPPVSREDIRIPRDERELFQNIVTQLKLDQTPELSDKLAIIRAWFLNDFTYTRELTISQERPTKDDPTIKPTPLARFLTDVRAGHCEYFASAATLILRQAGIPARYATGFAVVEKDPDEREYIIRGTHGHAWSRIWDQENSRWIDFDATPPDWSAIVARQITPMQRFNDSIKRLREDFFIWRNQPTNRLAVTLVMSTIGLALATFVFRRLWRSRRRIEDRPVVGEYHGTVPTTPLHTLEKPARKLIGPRPPGQTFARWLAGLRLSLPDPAPLDEAIALHQRLRFDPVPAPPHQHQRLADLSSQLASSLQKIPPRNNR